ncbi:MAG: HupE/UreJ family protein [Pseudomonadota bacterium]
MITRRAISQRAISRLVRLLLLALAAGLWAGMAQAHPEDEFCHPGGGVDPAVCRALAQMDDGARAAEPLLLGRTPFETAGLYALIGIRHILPGGLDHILFVLLLVLSMRGARQLILQLSVFTLAHAVTLGLATTGVIAPSPDWVEPLIAATILLVAIEVTALRQPPPWRSAAVFGFGLIHGMGFAGYFGSVGFPDNQFWSALIGFNIGVELGQGVVALVAAGVLALLARVTGRAAYGRYVVRLSAVLIGFVSLVWLVERLTAS